MEARVWSANETRRGQFLKEESLTAEETTTGPDTTQRGGHAVAAVGRHGGLDDLERLAQGGDLEQVEAGSKEQVGELDGLFLQLPGDGRGGGGGHDGG